MRRAVFLDRDGVINQPVLRDGKPFVPTTLSEFRILNGVPEALRMLKAQNFLCVVFTNQPDIAKGELDIAVHERIHEHMRRELPELDDIFVCMHVDADDCRCRKPRPGMLEEASAKWQIDCRRSYVVGDRWRDIDAGKAVGSTTILIRAPYSGPATPDWEAESLLEAVQRIVTIEGDSV